MRLEAEKLFSMMGSVHDLFKANNIIKTKLDDNIMIRHRIIYYDQAFHAESPEHVIYVQRYNVTP